MCIGKKEMSDEKVSEKVEAKIVSGKEKEKEEKIEMENKLKEKKEYTYKNRAKIVSNISEKAR